MMLAFAVADGKRCMLMKKGIEKYYHYSSTGDNDAISFGSLFNAKRFFELGFGQYERMGYFMAWFDSNGYYCGIFMFAKYR